MSYKIAIRVKSLTRSGLTTSEKHGKRLDSSSQNRRVNDRDPLTWTKPVAARLGVGGLELGKLFDLHTEGVRWNAAAKNKVSHALLQFPIDMEPTDENLKKFLDWSVEFINETHGNDAVFAARVDRDELGINKVDVFYTPKYEKTTKAGVTKWASLTKFQKELCYKHREEIERRHGGPLSNGKVLTGTRQCGIALNSEFRAFFTAKTGFELAPKQEKESKFSDWIRPDEFRARKSLEQRNIMLHFIKSFYKTFMPLLDNLTPKQQAFIEKIPGLSKPLRLNEVEQRLPKEPPSSPAASKMPDNRREGEEAQKFKP